MQNRFVLYTQDRAVSGGEAYWTGDFNAKGAPVVTQRLSAAVGFATPRRAYDKAHAHSEMQLFRVGRRPLPVNLRPR